MTASPRQIAVIALTVVGLMVAGWFGWRAYRDHEDDEKTQQLATQVEQSMQSYLNTDADLSKYTVRILTVDLNHIADTKYEGVATVNTAQSAKERYVPITVTVYGGERMMWEAKPGAFAFLAQEELQDTLGG